MKCRPGGRFNINNDAYSVIVFSDVAVKIAMKIKIGYGKYDP